MHIFLRAYCILLQQNNLGTLQCDFSVIQHFYVELTIGRKLKGTFAEFSAVFTIYEYV